MSQEYDRQYFSGILMVNIVTVRLCDNKIVTASGFSLYVVNAKRCDYARNDDGELCGAWPESSSTKPSAPMGASSTATNIVL